MKTMFKKYIELMAKRLDFMPVKECEVIVKILERREESLEKHKLFFEKIYFYAGNYPLWKAQQEFRELVNEKGVDSFSQSPMPVDDYLSKLIEETKMVLESEYPQALDYHWTEGLESARGESLKKCNNKTEKRGHSSKNVKI